MYMTEKLLLEDCGFENIAENYKIITENINNAMASAGRKDSVRMMAVTKTVPFEKVNYAVGLGADLLGENRAQELTEKYEYYNKAAEIHFIGGLQVNKVKYIIDKVKMIHSLDSIKLGEEINKRSAALGKVMDVLVEINIGDECGKNGIRTENAYEFIQQASMLNNLRVRGIMVIPPPNINGSSEKYFAATQDLFHQIKDKLKLMDFDTLSMGMSGDYQSAVKYGSTIVRIGSALFGYRKY